MPQYFTEKEFGHLHEDIPRLLALIGPEFFTSSRWFGEKDAIIQKITVADSSPIGATTDDSISILVILAFHLCRGINETIERRYFFPAVLAKFLNGADSISSYGGKFFDSGEVVAGSAGGMMPLVIIRGPDYSGGLFEGAGIPDFVNICFDSITRNLDILGKSGVFQFRAVPGSMGLVADGPRKVKAVSGEYSNSLFVVDDRFLCKTYRRFVPGRSPELDVSLALQLNTGFRRSPHILGYVEYLDSGGNNHTMMIIQEFILNAGDAWTVLGGLIRRYHGDDRTRDIIIGYAREMGTLVADLHCALASIQNLEFQPEPVEEEDMASWTEQAIQRLQEAFSSLSLRGDVDQILYEASMLCSRIDMSQFRDGLSQLEEQIKHHLDFIRNGVIEGDLALSTHMAPAHPESPAKAQLGMKIRIHGDLHLGQLLVGKDGFYVLDFEGEPLTGSTERKKKGSPLADVAGMIRSFSYAGHVFMGQEARMSRFRLERALSQAFLDSYFERVSRSCETLLPADPGKQRMLLELFKLSKVLYEISYEIKNRPGWAKVPLAGLLEYMNDWKEQNGIGYPEGKNGS